MHLGPGGLVGILLQEGQALLKPVRRRPRLSASRQRLSQDAQAPTPRSISSPKLSARSSNSPPAPTPLAHCPLQVQVRPRPGRPWAGSACSDLLRQIVGAGRRTPCPIQVARPDMEFCQRSPDVYLQHAVLLLMDRIEGLEQILARRVVVTGVHQGLAEVHPQAGAISRARSPRTGWQPFGNLR